MRSIFVTTLSLCLSLLVPNIGHTAPEPVVVLKSNSGNRIVLYVPRTHNQVTLAGTERMVNPVIGDVDGDGNEDEIVYSNSSNGGLGYYKIPGDGAWNTARDHVIPNVAKDAVPLAVVRWGYNGTTGIIVFKSTSSGAAYAIYPNGIGLTQIGAMDKAFAADLRQLGAKADLVWWKQGVGMKWREGVTGTDHASPWYNVVPVGGSAVVPGQTAKSILLFPTGADVLYACDKDWNITRLDGTSWPWSTTAGSVTVGDVDGDQVAEIVYSPSNSGPLNFYNVPNGGSPWNTGGTVSDTSTPSGWGLRGVAQVDLSTTQIDRFGDLRSMADGSVVNLAPFPRTKVIPQVGAQSACYYIEQSDRSAGIRVDGSTTAAEGQQVTITGTLQTSNGERVIVPSTQTSGATGSVVTPVLTTIKSIYSTLTMVGLLVRVTGSIVTASPTAGWFTMSDGSPQPLKIYCPGYNDTRGTVIATGCVGAELDSSGKVVPVMRVQSTTDIASTANPAPDPAPAGSYQYWIATSLDKVLKTDSIGSARTANLKAAKNEHEAFQIVLRPTAAMSGTTISTSNLTGAAGTIAASNVKVYLPWYINLPYYKRDVPDPLPPYSSPFNLAAGQTQPLWVDVYVPKTATAGNYSGSITINTTGGSAMQVPYTLHVYNFTLPDDNKLQVLVDFYDYYMAPKEGVTWGSAEDRALWKKYYEMLLDHGMSMPTYPTDDFFSAETTAYMKDPRVSVVRIPYDANSTKQAQYFNQVKANGQWGKHVLDAVDEATSQDQYNQVKVRANYYHSIDSTAKVLTTYYTATPSWAAPNHTTDLLAGYTGIWCPILGNAFEADRLAVRRAAGDKIWTYICTNPDGVSPNYFLQDPSMSHRIITWECYLHEATGWLYWHTNYWADVQDPWTDICTGKQIDGRLYGEGSLIYPGKVHTGVAGPVSSIRMEVWRDGMEDHKYLWLLEQKIGRAATLNYVKQVAQDWKVYTQNKDLFYSNRDQIAQKIEN